MFNELLRFQLLFLQLLKIYMPRILLPFLSILLLFACTGNDKKNSVESNPETGASNIPAPKNNE